MKGKVFLALLATLLVLAQACEPTEGCLDYDALRVDIQADEPCNDCCEYPRLILQILPVLTEPDTFSVVSRNQLLTNSAGDSLRLQSLVFFLSDMMLETADGDSIPLIDELQLRADTTQPLLPQPRSVYKIAALRQAGLTTGSLRGDQQLSALNFRLGLPADLYTYQPAAQANNSVLALGQDSFIYDRDVLQYRNGYAVLSSPADSFQLIRLDQDRSQRIRLPFPTVVELERSFNLRITIIVPVEAVAEWPEGTLSSALFAGELLERAQILRIELTR